MNLKSADIVFATQNTLSLKIFSTCSQTLFVYMCRWAAVWLIDFHFYSYSHAYKLQA